MRFGSVLILTLLARTLAAQAPVDITWLPISDAEKQQKAPVVEKDAGVEALFWNVHILDQTQGEDLQRVYYHYVRLKVFNEKGASQLSSIDIPLDDRTHIISLVGRTIKPDGTEVELTKDNIHDRDLMKAGGRTIRARSFAMPGVAAGAIVEYRWKEIQDNPNFRYTRLQFQREYPVQRVTYYIKPLSIELVSLHMGIVPFHCRPTPPKLERDGYNSVSLDNVPAFHDEPMMPGEGDLRQWALIYYHEDTKREPNKYWNDQGKRLYNDELKPALHINDEIKQAAKNAVEGADTDDKKILALIHYIRTHLRFLLGSDVTTAERAKLLKSFPKDRLRTSAEVFKSGIGTDDELNTLLAAMASQVGLEAKPAMVGDRNNLTFSPQLADVYFLESTDMAVKIADKWKIYDVSARNTPSGMLATYEEGMQALLSDPKQPIFIDVPIAAPELSRATHTGKFTLSTEGTLEGDAVEMLTGHTGAMRRGSMQRESEARRLELVKERLTKIFTEAEVTNVKIEDFSDPDKPLRISYHIKIDNYAQRTGKRMLFQPLYFQQGEAAVFSATERKYPVMFPYAWSESDNFTITLPDGFALDNASNVPAMNFGKPGSYGVKFSIRGKHELICQRDLTFGSDEQTFFPIQSYPQLKHAFDEIHTQDTQTISLKVDEASK